MGFVEPFAEPTAANGCASIARNYSYIEILGVSVSAYTRSMRGPVLDRVEADDPAAAEARERDRSACAELVVARE